MAQQLMDPPARNAAPGSRLFVYAVSGVAAVGGLLFGFDTAIISGAEVFIKAQFQLSAFTEGIMVSSLLVGCMVGAATAGLVSDRLGRKKVLVATAAAYVISAVLSAFPQTLVQLVAARFLGGLAVGLSSMVAPMYIAEIAPAEIRGRLVSLQQMAIVIGILIAQVIAGALADVGPNNWRYMFASAAVPAFLLLLALVVVPESPRWLAAQGRTAQAEDILARVNGRERARVEMAEITTTLADEPSRIAEMFQPGLRLALMIGVVLAVLGQVSGINTIIYYAPKIFLASGFPDASAAIWAQVSVGLVNFVFTILSMWLVDRMGRKLLLLIGSGGMAASLVGAALLLTREGVPLWVKVGLILAYIAFFAIGVGGVVWVVLSEIFPNRIRGRATSVAVVGVWAACCLVSLTFPWLIENLGQRSFWIYAVMSAAMFLFVLAALPETKGKSLEQIERAWRK